MRESGIIFHHYNVIDFLFKLKWLSDLHDTLIAYKPISVYNNINLHEMYKNVFIILICVYPISLFILACEFIYYNVINMIFANIFSRLLYHG